MDPSGFCKACHPPLASKGDEARDEPKDRVTQLGLIKGGGRKGKRLASRWVWVKKAKGEIDQNPGPCGPQSFSF